MNTPFPGLQQALNTGIAQGLLPADAHLPESDGRPWPVILLTALGAWLAAVPLIGVVGLLLGDLISKSVGPYFTGVLVLAAAVTVLRSRELPVFVEQLAVPALLVGSGALAFGLYRDLSPQAAAAVLAALALGLASAIPRPWLRVLLGAAAAGLVVQTLLPIHVLWRHGASIYPLWLALHAALLLWAWALYLQQRSLAQGPRARMAAALESIGAGWLLMVLAGMCWWSGMTFLVGGSLGGGMLRELSTGSGPSRILGAGSLVAQTASVALAGAAASVTARDWPSLRQPLAAAVALVLAVLCWFLPVLGAVLLALASMATSQRWRLATAAAFAAAWIVGSFYYQLHWTLANKAVVLVGLGAVLGGLTWWARRAGQDTHGLGLATVASHQQHAAAWMALGAVLTLVLANFSIWQKETLIARGERVFVELAPVDPRSLMQGDFMRLNYRVPTGAEPEPRQLLTQQRPHVIAVRDARGVAQLLRVTWADAPLAAGEMRIELTPKDGRWILVSDAWFFREGDARRWEAAKYGEFRVAPDGKALLVGLADAQLQAIAIEP